VVFANRAEVVFANRAEVVLANRAKAVNPDTPVALVNPLVNLDRTEDLAKAVKKNAPNTVAEDIPANPANPANPTNRVNIRLIQKEV